MGLILPQIQSFIYDEEVLPQGSNSVEFRLVYDGRLRASAKGNNRSDDKHIIRKVLHRQLRELCHRDANLRYIMEERHMAEHLAADFQRGDGFAFVPLINQRFSAFASLDILFLRRDSPGNLIQNAGDIDNRVKTLFDALKVPRVRGDISADKPDDDEHPFFCLLEDDALITSLKVTTDRLLWPLNPEAPTLPDHPLSDVFLVIHVKTGVFTPNSVFASFFQ
jgi:hypothetical protein